MIKKIILMVVFFVLVEYLFSNVLLSVYFDNMTSGRIIKIFIIISVLSLILIVRYGMYNLKCILIMLSLMILKFFIIKYLDYSLAISITAITLEISPLLFVMSFGERRKVDYLLTTSVFIIGDLVLTIFMTIGSINFLWTVGLFVINSTYYYLIYKMHYMQYNKSNSELQ
jgi:hypothetical protein